MSSDARHLPFKLQAPLLPRVWSGTRPERSRVDAHQEACPTSYINMDRRSGDRLLDTMDHPSWAQDDRYPRSTSVPPPLRPSHSVHERGASNPPTPSSMSQKKPVEPTLMLSPTDREDATWSATTLDLMSHLQRSGPSIVKTRTGSVLSRGFILKTDYYPSGT